MTKTILFTRPMQCFADSNEVPIRSSLANFLAIEYGLQPHFEQSFEKLDWLDFDYVAPYSGIVDTTDTYHRHYLSELQKSIAAGQQRVIHWDDSYFMPLSALKQVGLPDDYEYTIALMLDKNMRMEPDAFTRYEAWHSSSLDKARRVLAKRMWAYPTRLQCTAQCDVAKLERRALYAGYPKSDRLLLPVVYYGRWPYSQYLAECSRSLACVMANSESHRQNVTPRFYESGMLSIQLWPEHVHVCGFVRPPSRVFASEADLIRILDELASQTPTQRAAELQEQQHAVLSRLGRSPL